MKKVYLVVLASTLFASGVSATIISLDTDSLPSTQGWIYDSEGVEAGIAEASVFSTDGSVLTVNSMGGPISSSAGGIFCRHLNVVQEGMPSVLEWTSRTLESEGSPSIYYGFYVAFRTSTKDYSVGLRHDRIGVRNGAGFQEILMDASEYHTYRIEAVAGASTYDFYIDGDLIASPAPKSASLKNQVIFGDGTGAANAKTEIASLQFSQVPEPSVVGLMGFFGGALIFIRRNVRRNFRPKAWLKER